MPVSKLPFLLKSNKYSVDYEKTERFRISSAKEAYRIVLDQWDCDKLDLLNEFKIVLLNRGNKILGITIISQGGVSGTVTVPRLIFGTALKAVAGFMILVHNHPSGNLGQL